VGTRGEACRDFETVAMHAFEGERRAVSASAGIGAAQDPIPVTERPLGSGVL